MAALSKPRFFEQMAAHGVALTFSDVRVEPGPSDYSPGDVDISSRFSTNVELKTPMVSAAMDTVTTSDMAIAMAKLGGLGIVHAALSPEEQRREVRRVKLHLNGRIESPRTVTEHDSLEAVLKWCEEKRYEFRTFPVVDSKGVMVGLLTQNDFDFCSDKSRSVHKAMTPMDEVITASSRTTIRGAYRQMLRHKKKTLPLLHRDGTVAGLYIWSDVNRIINDNSGLHNTDENGRLRVGAAVTTDTDDKSIEHITRLSEYLDVLVVDTAQGDSKFAFAALKKFKETFNGLDIVVGNVSNSRSAKLLAEAGADGVKIGQGPGSICTTRMETGIGYPQVTAVYECVKAIGKLGVPVCADGGITSSGDISIAIAAGAHSVMMGNVLAGTKEAPGEIIELDDGQLVMIYRGMGSPEAMKESATSLKRYQAEGSGTPLAEGVESFIPYKGSVVDVMDHNIKALRKSMSYVGAKDIATHRRKTRIFQITNSGLTESRPHDVRVITRTKLP